MPYLKCANCGNTLEINAGAQNYWNHPNPDGYTSKITGSIICRSCGHGTGFELYDNVIVYISGKSSFGVISEKLSQTVKTLFSEAEISFMNGTPDAVVAMCRSSLEIALNEKGIKGNNLYEMIENAKDILGTIEYSLAHASRLVTRDAIHRAELVSLSDVPSMLSATVRVLNKVAG